MAFYPRIFIKELFTNYYGRLNDYIIIQTKSIDINELSRHSIQDDGLNIRDRFNYLLSDVSSSLNISFYFTNII
jgi:hypothetical protein